MTRKQIEKRITDVTSFGSSCDFSNTKTFVLNDNIDRSVTNKITVKKCVGAYIVTHTVEEQFSGLDEETSTVSEIQTTDLDRIIDDVTLFLKQ